MKYDKVLLDAPCSGLGVLSKVISCPAGSNKAEDFFSYVLAHPPLYIG